ncbi:MAG: cytochrome-c peroxidase, partial [Planctomycetota bacterium]
MMHAVAAFLLLLTNLLAQAILPPPPVPAGNPMTPEKVMLGKLLFWDEQLSSSRSVGCGSCHILRHDGTDPRVDSLHPGLDGVFGTADDVFGSPGVLFHDAAGAPRPSLQFGIEVQITHRRAPSVINAAYATKLFVDGRADDVFRDPVSGAVVLASGGTLENQIAEPPVSEVEMGHIGRTWTDVANTLPTLKPLDLATTVPRAMTRFIGGRTYDALFTQVFGSPGITPVRIIFAIASYERSLISDRSPFDLYLAGQGQLSPLAQQGLQRFQTLCASCHTDL